MVNKYEFYYTQLIMELNSVDIKKAVKLTAF